MNIKYIHPADQLVMFMQRIYDKGMTTTSGGNLSIMDDDGNMWITPAGVDKGTLTRNDIVCVKPDGTHEGVHRPSSEFPFHAAVYKMRPDLRAVLHAHPPALVAFSIVRQLPDLDLLPSVRKVCNSIEIAKYAVPGSDVLGENIGACFADGGDIVILENHGVCIGAPDMFTAFQRFETLDLGHHFIRQVFIARPDAKIGIRPGVFRKAKGRHLPLILPDAPAVAQGGIHPG